VEVVGADVAAMQPAILVTYSSGVVIDLTLRIGGVQPEIAASASALQITTSLFDITESGYPSVSVPLCLASIDSFKP